MKSKLQSTNGAARNGSASSSRDWKPFISQYSQRRLLRFVSDQQLDAAIDLLWKEELRGMPFDTPDGKSIIMPAEGVEFFSAAGLKFTNERLLSMSELTQKEIGSLRNK